MAQAANQTESMFAKFYFFAYHFPNRQCIEIRLCCSIFKGLSNGLDFMRVGCLVVEKITKLENRIIDSVLPVLPDHEETFMNQYLV